ncbi:MAG: hypothetical protein KAZ87_03385 [Spirochaetes bacterium]|nr:hypothetical protein [Spirochaetota bacterium]
MKRYFLILLMIFPVSAYSRWSLNPEIAYISTGDSLSPFMLGASIETDLMKNLSLGYRFGKASETKNADTINEEKIDFMINMFYVQYRHQIKNLPLYGFGEFGAGYSNAKVTDRWSSMDTASYEKKDRGPILSLRAGTVYDFSQNISLFAGLGWHKSLYSGSLDAAGKSISGYQLFIGVKFNIFGSNNEMESRY